MTERQALQEWAAKLRRSALSWLIACAVKLLLKTLKVSREGPSLEGGGVVAFLHGEQLPLLLQLPSAPRVTPVSLSADGALQALIMARFQVDVVRGSSSRGALRLLRELYRRMTQSPELFTLVAVDGPRGPYGVAHPGAAYLASQTGRPLWLCRVSCDRAWVLKTWDRFIIPAPFSSVHITTTQIQAEALDLQATLTGHLQRAT